MNDVAASSVSHLNYDESSVATLPSSKFSLVSGV